MFDGTAGQQQAVFQLEGVADRAGLPERVPRPLTVLRVHHLQKGVERGAAFAGAEFKDPEHLVRPEQATGRNVKVPVAHPGHVLRLLQSNLAGAHGLAPALHGPEQAGNNGAPRQQQQGHQGGEQLATVQRRLQRPEHRLVGQPHQQHGIAHRQPVPAIGPRHLVQRADRTVRPLAQGGVDHERPGGIHPLAHGHRVVAAARQVGAIALHQRHHIQRRQVQRRQPLRQHIRRHHHENRAREPPLAQDRSPHRELPVLGHPPQHRRPDDHAIDPVAEVPEKHAVTDVQAFALAQAVEHQVALRIDHQHVRHKTRGQRLQEVVSHG
ncbi:hypothetical protein FQZ97_873220 [compost metagenome]